ARQQARGLIPPLARGPSWTNTHSKPDSTSSRSECTMALNPEQKLWLDQVAKLRKEERARDEAMLAVKGGSEKAKERDLIKAKLEDHLVASGRARGSGTEAERAEKENTLANEVTERIELSANATYVSEDVADVVLASYDLPTVPLTAPVRTTFAARRPNNVAL